MSSTNKTSLGLNLWEASDKPVRQDFVNDNTIIDEKITKINSNLDNVNSNLTNLSNDLLVDALWTGNVSNGNITLSNSVDDYKALILNIGSPAATGWDTHIIRRWLEYGWQYVEQGKIAFPVQGGYVQLVITSTTQITILHADLAVRGIYGLKK